MNNELNNIIKAVQALKLTESEKVSMKASIISGATGAGVTNSIPSRLYHGGYTNYINLFIKQNNFMAALIIALMLAVTGGTSAVAENATPGDALYQMKVSFNEPVVGLLKVSDEDKITWQERLVERRLEEAQKAVAEGNVSTSTKEVLETNVTKQVEKFNSRVKDFSKDDEKRITSSELAIRLESALKAHQNALETAVVEGKVSTSTAESLKGILSVLKEKEIEVKIHREEVEIKLGDREDDDYSTSTPEISALNKQAVAEKILNNVKAKFQEEKANLATTTIATIETNLAGVDALLTEGKAAVTAKNYDEARDLFQKVIKSSNNIRVNILTGSIKNDIDDENDEDEDRENRDNKKADREEKRENKKGLENKSSMKNDNEEDEDNSSRRVEVGRNN